MATKTGGGLLGRADAQLVQGAYRAEMANIGPNMKGVYDMQVENVANLQTAVQDFFYAFDKSNNDLRNEVKELTPKLLADIETGTYIDDSYVDLVSQEINSLREQMKSIPKGREGEAERAKIRTRLANLKAESGSAEQTMTKIATLIDNDQIDFNSLQEGDMELWKSILDKSAKREFVDGKLVYSASINGKELKISHSDLEKRFIPKQYGVQNNALKLSNSFINVGKQGLGYDFNGAMNAYETLMTNKQEVLGLINNPFGSMQYSFTDALKGKDPNLTKELIGALNNVGGFDVDNDGIPDQITMSNLNKLVSTLTNPDDENFNLATTKRIAAAFYADNDGRIQYNKGKSLFDAKKPSTPGFNEGGVPIFKKSIKVKKGGDNNYESAAVATRLWKGLSNGLVSDPVDNTEYRWLGDGWYVGDDKKFDTTDDLVNEFGIQDDRFYGINSSKVEKDMRDPNTVDTEFGTGSDIKIFDTGNDNTISNNFNKLIFPRNDKRNPEGLHFMPSGSKSKFGDNLLTQSITLYDKFDNKVQLNGEDVTFKVGSLSDGQKETMLGDILKILDDKKVLSNDDAGL